MEVAQRQQPLVWRYVVVSGLGRRTIALEFTIPASALFGTGGDEIEFRVATIGLAAGRFTAATLHVGVGGG